MDWRWTRRGECDEDDDEVVVSASGEGKPVADSEGEAVPKALTSIPSEPSEDCDSG